MFYGETIHFFYDASEAVCLRHTLKWRPENESERERIF